MNLLAASRDRRVRTIFISTLASALVVTAASGGCASRGSGANGLTDDADSGPMFVTETADGGGAFTGDCPGNLESIEVSPSAGTARIAYAQKPAAVTLTARGTFAGGATMDVTGCAAWTTSDPGLGNASGGVFSPVAPGQFTVTASNGSVSGSATVTVKLTGTVNATGVDTTKLDGTPSGTAPKIAYPLDGALFPYHLGDLAFQMVPSASGQTLARVAFEGEAIDLRVYAPCTPIPSPAMSGACSVTHPADIEQTLAGASTAPTLTETVRLAASDGSSLAESTAISARWSATPLSGTIYYWSTPSQGMTGSSEIVRMDLTSPGTAPEVYYTNLDAVPYANPLSGGWACVGCHAISRDGSKLGITIGGSSIQANGDGYGSLFALLDVAKKTPTATRIADDAGQQLLNDGFATLTTFSPDGTSMVQELQGQLYLRTADATLASQGPLFPTMTESLTQPAWSSAGDRLVFASWVPTLNTPHSYDSKDLNGNETPNAQIWTATASGSTFGTPSLLVPRVTGATEYYPAISDDSAYVVFNESSCDGPASPGVDGYGSSPCDSYDDPSARLRLIPTGGGKPLELDHASGRTSGWPTSDTWTNSWPRFAPDHGTFRGKARSTGSGSPGGAPRARRWPVRRTAPPRRRSGSRPSRCRRGAPSPATRASRRSGFRSRTTRRPRSSRTAAWRRRSAAPGPPPATIFRNGS